MRFAATACAFLLAVSPLPAAAQDLCGGAPALPSQETSRRVDGAVFRLMLSSAAGKAFAEHAAATFSELTAGMPQDDARRVALALVQRYCLQLTRNHPPAPLSWHVKDHIAGMTALVPDFHEARAIVSRLEAVEGRR